MNTPARLKLLVLESAWRHAPDKPPTETRSAGKLYCSVQGLITSYPPVACLHKPLVAAACADEISRFAALPENRRGHNVIVLSAHGHLAEEREHEVLAADDGALVLRPLLTSLRSDLKRTILILDACHLGKHAQALREICDAVGVVGFGSTVNWTASGVFILALLRRFYAGGILHIPRALPLKPRKLLHEMQIGGYKTLSDNLGVRGDFRPSRRTSSR